MSDDDSCDFLSSSRGRNHRRWYLSVIDYALLVLFSGDLRFLSDDDSCDFLSSSRGRNHRRWHLSVIDYALLVLFSSDLRFLSDGRTVTTEWSTFQPLYFFRCVPVATDSHITINYLDFYLLYISKFYCLMSDMYFLLLNHITDRSPYVADWCVCSDLQ